MLAFSSASPYYTGMAQSRQAKKREPAARDRDGALYAIVGRDTIDHLDEWVKRLNASTHGPKWSRQDLVRVVLAQAYEQYGVKGVVPDASVLASKAPAPSP